MSEQKVTIVCGPPCSGKTTYVQERANPADMVIDYDDIARQLGSPRTHNHDIKYHARVESIIRQACRAIGKIEANAWVIRSLPSRDERDALARRLGAEVVVIDAPDEVLLARAQQRPDPSKTIAAIRSWRRASDDGISPHA